MNNVMYCSNSYSQIIFTVVIKITPGNKQAL